MGSGENCRGNITDSECFRDGPGALSLMIRIYQLIYKKYHPRYYDLLGDLESANVFTAQDLLSLKRSLADKTITGV